MYGRIGGNMITNLNTQTINFLKELNNISEETLNAQLSVISKIKDKNTRLSWKRKYDKLTEMVEKEIHPVEEQIQALFLKKQELMDVVLELRNILVKECIHPKDQLIHKVLYVECKFCNSKLKIPAMNDYISESGTDE